MNKEQLYAAQTAMIEWLSDPHELGKKPFKIECAGEFDFNEIVLVCLASVILTSQAI